MEPTFTALIVPVPEAEPAVAAHREHLDQAAGWGVPAHVTVLVPFLPPADIDEHVLTALGQVVAGEPAFFLTLRKLGWFGDRVLWLDPEPADPFRRLTAAICARFPGVAPYDGEFDEVVPHLTIGHDHPPAALVAAGEAVQAHGPIHAPVTAVRLLAGRREPGSWTTLADLPLG